MTHRSDSTFIATAIPYVNARPHVGFAFEIVLADVLARHARLRGADVVFASGTDDHSLKNVLAAEAAGVPTGAFVAAHTEAFRALGEALDARYDAFVPTSTDPRHRAAVERLWDGVRRAGDVRRDAYRGLYCVGCEAFYEPSDLTGDRCAEHDAPLELVEEENWFFDLARWGDLVRERIESGALRIEPDSARAETLAFLRNDLRPLSVSRPVERARGWGIGVPGDPSQVFSVWFDALAYYLATGDWERAANRVHVVGKGITRFHTVLWPAFLASAGLPLPTQVLVHGYLTTDGQKISKSGRTLDPLPVIAEHGADATRWFLVRHLRSTRDGDFRIERLREAHDTDLANQLGNLVQRTLRLAETTSGGVRPTRDTLEPIDEPLLSCAAQLNDVVDEAVGRFALDEAAAAVVSVATACNRYLDRTTPWAEPRGALRARHAVAIVLDVLDVVAHELTPFLPSAATRLRALLDARPLRPGAPLFPRRSE